MSSKKALFSVLCGVALIAGCASDAPKPAAKPEAAPAPAPAPAPVPRAAEPVKPAAAPEAKKPAIINLSSTELFEFNKATLTADARGKLDAEVIAKLKDLGDIRYVNVNGHADRLGAP